MGFFKNQVLSWHLNQYVNTGSTTTATISDDSNDSFVYIAADTNISTPQTSGLEPEYAGYPFRKVRIIQGELWYDYLCSACGVGHHFQTNEAFDKHLFKSMSEKIWFTQSSVTTIK